MIPATILVADDDRAIRTVLSQALGRQGHEVKATGSADQLWDWVQAGHGDLVITDVVMPDQNGLELIPNIKKARPSLRIIVMSAQNTLLTAVKATERGAFEYLPKPFDLREVVNIVERALSAPQVSPSTAGDERPKDAEGEEEQLPLIGR
jgi:two-component system nitrogen regulation response regulator GlnG